MPKGPNGERRPADTNACAVMVAKIATGEVEDTKTAKRGSAGGRARAERMSAAERKEIAERAAAARWNTRRRNMTDQITECAALIERDKVKRQNGLVDVKFFLRSSGEALKEEICAEVNRLDEALERGDWVPLVFNDKRI
jgi:hypothetical protein